MTIFLTALFMMAINEEMSKMQKKKAGCVNGSG